MITTFKDASSKAFVGLVAAAMVFSLFAPAAQAQSAEDLQKMINDLLAQVASLQGQVGQGANSVASGVCPYTWTRDLSQGSTGPDVMKLQQFLNGDLDTRVAAEGAGSVGMETQYFGPATAAAVSKMQVKYRAEVLSPAGLVNPTGFFGPSSRAKANSVCVVAPTTPTTPTTPGDMDEDMDDEDEDMDDDMMELSGEASLDTFEVEDGESTIEEGDTDEVIAEIMVEFVDGDASISRLDVMLTHESNGQPWDAFETISLWVDGEMVAEFDASDEDDYLDEDTGELRFSGLDIVAMEDEELEILVGATVMNSLDNEERGDWTFKVTAMRFFDADGVATTENGAPVTDDSVEFDIQEAGEDEELNISLSSSNPDATDIVVDTDTDTNDVTIMVADLEAEDNDIELNTVVVRIDTTNATTTNVIDEVRVMIDGESFDSEPLGQLSAGKSQIISSTSVWYLFDIDGDVVIDEDSEVEMEVVIDFNDTDDGVRYGNNVTIKATVGQTERNAWEAEGADDLIDAQFSGTAVGDAHTLVAEGILVPVDGFTSEEDTQGDNDTLGVFTLEFEVTGVEENFYITDNATTTTPGNPANGVGFTLTGGAVTTLTSSLTSTADEDTPGVFTVREGETETFTLVVTVDAAAAGVYRVSLDEIWYTEDTDGVTGTEVYLPTPVSDYRSATLSINQ